MSRFPRFSFFRRETVNGYDLPRMWSITVGDVNSFSQLWSFKITSLRLAGIILVCAVTIAVIGVVFVVATPLRSVLPGYLGSGSRGAYEAMAFRLDSLSAVVDYQNDYLNNIAAIFNDEVVEFDSEMLEVADSVGLIPVDSLLPTSELERRFVKQYEQREKHNLSVLSPITAEGMSFFKPVASAVVDNEDNSMSGHEVRLLTTSGARVSSVYRGTVVATWVDPSSGFQSVAIQHPRDFFSTYSGLSSVYVSKGDKVNAGTAVGVTGGKKPMLSFELWHNGSILNPRDYIDL